MQLQILLLQFIGAKEIVERDYDQKISPAYKKIAEAYAQGLNRYAELHPEEVLVKELFPLTPKRMLHYAQLQLFISSRGDYWVSRIVENNVKLEQPKEEITGSNTFAFNSSKTLTAALISLSTLTNHSMDPFHGMKHILQ